MLQLHCKVQLPPSPMAHLGLHHSPSVCHRTPFGNYWILPTLLYPIQMIPVMFLHKTIKQLNSWFSSFIWSKRKPRLKMATLCLSYTEEGVDLPDIRKFQFSVHLRNIADWMGCKSTSLWLDIESSMSKYPLSNLLFIRKSASLKSACTNPITISTVKAWHAIRKLGADLNSLLSLLQYAIILIFLLECWTITSGSGQIKENPPYITYLKVLPCCLLTS